jgi:hypothetical protein
MHNKSQKTHLSLLDHPDDELGACWDTISATELLEEPGLFKNSPCWVHNSNDGRVSVQGKKIFYAYQLAAWKKFGRDAIYAVPANKVSRDSLVISHLCGSENSRCSNPEHLLLEPKWINDERTHCHFVLANILSNSGRNGLRMAKQIGVCQHQPPCFRA